MILIHTEKYGVIQVKPLGVIWGKFPQYNKENKIMFDDLRRNFLMNPCNELKIRPFKNAHSSCNTDTELFNRTVQSSNRYNDEQSCQQEQIRFPRLRTPTTTQ